MNKYESERLGIKVKRKSHLVWETNRQHPHMELIKTAWERNRCMCK